jgi:hypothetical protein
MLKLLSTSYFCIYDLYTSIIYTNYQAEVPADHPKPNNIGHSLQGHTIKSSHRKITTRERLLDVQVKKLATET